MADNAPVPKRPLAVTVGAAAATLIIVFAVLTGPSVVNCFSSPEGVGACLQGRLSDIGLMPPPDGTRSTEAAAIDPAATAPGPESSTETQATALAVSESPADDTTAEPASQTPPASQPDTSVVANAPAVAQPTEGSVPAVTRAPITPTFSLLRAEPDGSVVIAGSGEPGSELELYANGDLFGRVTVEQSGDWVFIPDAPLAPGNYEITLRIAGSDSPVGQSIVVAINDDKTSEPLVVATTPGEASQVLQGIARPDGAAPRPVEQVASAEPPQTPRPRPEAAVQQDEPVQLANAAPQAPTGQDATDEALVPPTIDAVEIEGQRNFFAGEGLERATIRLYVDDAFIADARVNGGRWLIEAQDVLKKASQRIRADMLRPGTTEVVARAEVNFEMDVPGDAPAVATARTDENEPASAIPSATDTAAAPAEPSDEAVPTMVGTQQGDPEAQRVAAGKAIIRRGDNLWSIARRVYGQGIRYTTIYEANTEQIRDPNRIYPGQVFALPQSE